jgi:hypothetical protein
MILRLLLLAIALSSAALARPIIGHASDERINYATLGISIVVPKDTSLIGSKGSQEPQNYVWPWLKTSYGQIEIATGPKSKGGEFQKTMDDYLKTEHPRGFKLVEVTPMQIGDIPVVKTFSEDATGFRIIRYYFTTPSGVIAFFHLHSWRDQAALESIISSMKKTEQGAAANP